MLKASDIEARILAADALLIKQGEEIIDKALEAEWSPGGTVVIDMNAQFPSRVVDELANMYRTQGGWAVTVNRGTQGDEQMKMGFKKPDTSPGGWNYR